ncbi:alpha-tocopherol transfer protein-like, partial [Teleopsis dalmanni]|uniref:alpha-tocopherol transfer protein-like n=1 Tax=Teleopsis dalmanni TaxID=139649 RepID=UPI0018CE1DA4
MGDRAYEAQIDELMQWFQENEKLPKEIDRLLLKRFYECMYRNVEDTKKLIRINYKLRNKYDHIFLDRDPNSEQSQNTFAYADLIPLPGLTPENYKVSCYRLHDFDHKKMNHIEDTKSFFMVTDCRFCIPDLPDSDQLSEGEVQIFDMNGFSMKHFSRMTIGTMRIYLKFLQEAFPVRLKAVHLINCPTYLDKIVSVVKPFINREVFKMIHFHTNGINGLYEHVPRSMLPEEYGGDCGSFEKLKAQTMLLLQQKRSYLIDSQHWKIELKCD